MPVAAGPQAYEVHFPSFMSVFGVESSGMGSINEIAVADETKQAMLMPSATQAQSEPEASSQMTSALQQTDVHHKHRDSTSSHASESNDSSPTTTISTADSSSLTDPSPSSSPQSPITIVPLSSFSATSFNSLDDLTVSDRAPEPKLLNCGRPMTSPSPRKPRNTKGLALKLPSLGGDEKMNSIPSSPSFVKPPTMKPRKKPSILSLQTTATNPLPRLSGGRFVSEPPPTPGPSKDPMLRHAASSPQMLFSPGPGGTEAPEGGMQLPPFERSRVTGLSSTFRRPSTFKESSSCGSSLTIDEEESPIRTQMATRSLFGTGGDSFDHPPSQEDARSPGYPDGPISIYEPNIYLYLEPTAEEAEKFDVIMNVASEVKNPFQAISPSNADKPFPELPSTIDGRDCDRDSIPEPNTAMSTATFKTAFEFQPSNPSNTPTDASPTTPKPVSKQPEYIHIPWEHNTDISKDLLELCEIIDSRSRQGKKVLVHCQQGASRSASLIIAYGLYKNPKQTVNDAYLAAQQKSQWISPNMKLMYCLQDFHSQIKTSLLPSAGIFGRTGGRSPTRHRTTLSADNAELAKKEPLTAPLPSEKESNTQIDSSPVRQPSRPRGSSTPDCRDISPAPLSAPSSFGFDLHPLVPQAGLQSERSSSAESFEVISKVNTSAELGFQDDSQLRPRIQNASSSPNTGFAAHRRGLGQKNLLLQDAFFPRSISEDRLPDSETADEPREKHATRSFGDVPPTPALWSPRVHEMTINPMRSALNFGPPLGESGQKGESILSGLMSPRIAEFSENPFHHARFADAQDVASSFGFSTAADNEVPSTEDPRSPATKGEAPIIRSIDDVL